MKIFTKAVPIFLSIILVCISCFLGIKILRDNKDTTLNFTDTYEITSVIHTSELPLESTVTAAQKESKTTEAVTFSSVYFSTETSSQTEYFTEQVSSDIIESSESQSKIISSEAVNESSDYKSGVVYITATGSKFHTEDCQYLSKSSFKINRAKAINEGYTPCSRCKP